MNRSAALTQRQSGRFLPAVGCVLWTTRQQSRYLAEEGRALSQHQLSGVPVWQQQHPHSCYNESKEPLFRLLINTFFFFCLFQSKRGEHFVLQLTTTVCVDILRWEHASSELHQKLNMVDGKPAPLPPPFQYLKIHWKIKMTKGISVTSH